MSDVIFPELLTMSRDECEKFIAGPNDACISIRSSNPESQVARLSGNYRHVLFLVFDDWGWPEPPLRADGTPFLFTQIDEAIADQVIGFVNVNRDVTRLVVHCEAGVSRSVSLAMAVAKCFTGKVWRPRWLFGHTFKPGTCAPNQIVYDAIVAAYERSKEVPASGQNDASSQRVVGNSVEKIRR